MLRAEGDAPCVSATRLMLSVGVGVCLPVENSPQLEPFQPVSPVVDLSEVIKDFFSGKGYNVKAASYTDFEYEDDVEPRPGEGTWFEDTYIWGEVEVEVAEADARRLVDACRLFGDDDFLDVEGFDLFMATYIK